MRISIAVLLGVILPLQALAQPLADRVPAEAILYIGWQGTATPAPGYSGSHLKGILDNSNIPKVASEFLPRLFQFISREDPNAAIPLKILSDVGSPIWRHPTALYFAGVDFAGGMPRPKLGLICRAGNEADAMLTQFNNLVTEAQNQGLPFPVRAQKRGDIVAISVGYDPENVAVAGEGSPAEPIIHDDRFTQAIAQVQKDAVALFYIDVQAVLSNIEQAIEFNQDMNAKQMWPKVRDALGVAGLKRIIWSAGFDGADWGTRTFISAPAPRAGLLAMLDAPALSDDVLRSIPRSSTIAAAGRFDLAKLVREIRAAAGKIDPQAQQMFNQGLGLAQMALAMNVETDLFETLGDEWAVFLDPATAGNGPLGFTMLNRLRKPDQASKALSKLELFIDNTVNGQLAPMKMRLGFEQMDLWGNRIHYLASPVVSPSWMVKNGTLYAALYPQVVAAAGSNQSGGSIIDNPQFTALRQRLGGQQASGMAFIDLPRTADQGYQILLILSQAGMGIADMAGIKAPPPLIPPLAKLKEHLSPAASFSWSDDAGWHARSVSPFPGAELLGLPR